MRGEAAKRIKDSKPRLDAVELALNKRFIAWLQRVITSRGMSRSLLRRRVGYTRGGKPHTLGKSTLAHWEHGYQIPGHGRGAICEQHLERLLGVASDQGVADEAMERALRGKSVKPNWHAYTDALDERQGTMTFNQVPAPTEPRLRRTSGELREPRGKKGASSKARRASERMLRAAPDATEVLPGDPMRSSELVAALQAAEMSSGGDPKIYFRMRISQTILVLPVTAVVDGVGQEGQIILE